MGAVWSRVTHVRSNILPCLERKSKYRTAGTGVSIPVSSSFVLCVALEVQMVHWLARPDPTGLFWTAGLLDLDWSDLRPKTSRSFQLFFLYITTDNSICCFFLSVNEVLLFIDCHSNSRPWVHTDVGRSSKLGVMLTWLRLKAVPGSRHRYQKMKQTKRDSGIQLKIRDCCIHIFTTTSQSDVHDMQIVLPADYHRTPGDSVC